VKKIVFLTSLYVILSCCALSGGGVYLEEMLGLRILYSLRGPVRPPQNIAIIAINRDTSRALHQSLHLNEWDRTLHKLLIEKLIFEKPKLIAFDIFFKESKKEDHELAKTVKKAGNVILFSKLEKAAHPSRLTYEKLIPPTQVLSEASIANVNFALPKIPQRVDEFWTFRPTAGGEPTAPSTILTAYFAALYPDLVNNFLLSFPHPAALQLYQSLNKESPIPVAKETSKLYPEPLLPLFELITKPELHYLNFYGPPRTFRTIPYEAIFKASSLEQFALKDAILFVGYSEIAPEDQIEGFYTVYTNKDGLDLSGVEIAATAFANLLERKTLYFVHPCINILFILFFTTLITTSALFLNTRISLLAALIAELLYCVSAFFFFSISNKLIFFVIPVFVELPLAYTTGRLIYFLSKRKKFDNITNSFKAYLPEIIIKRFEKNKGDPFIAPSQEWGVILNTDAECYTKFAENLSSEVLHIYLNTYYKSLITPIREHEGYVSDIIGDGMLALWHNAHYDAALQTKENCHARKSKNELCALAYNAVRVLLSSMDTFNLFNPQKKLTTRIGLHCGEISIGSIGALDHFEYRALGDPINTACRIQSLNKHLKTRVICSEAFLQSLECNPHRYVGTFLLYGKSAPLKIYELFHTYEKTPHYETESAYMLFQKGLQFYEYHEYTQSLDCFLQCLKVIPDDGPSQFYTDRCLTFLNTPKEIHTSSSTLQDKNGVIVMNVK
jgi:adenylate cyclase